MDYYALIKKWNTDTIIEWRNEQRRKLNDAIAAYNFWHVIDKCDIEKGEKLLVELFGVRSSINVDEAEFGILEELDKMMKLVREIVAHNGIVRELK